MKQYKRIVSLVPSLTELLIFLGAEDRLVGRTRFCIHLGANVQNIPIIGGTKNPGIEKILALKPDLIIANKEENRKEDIEALRSSTEILVTEIDSISSALMEISRIGKTLQLEHETSNLLSEVENELKIAPTYHEVSCLYLIWRDPWMSIGTDTYIHDVMNTFGLKNLMRNTTRYPSLSIDELKDIKPELILLSSEPYPFKEKHVQELSEICPYSDIQLIDGEWFSWYGNRMLPSFQKLKHWRAFI